MYNCVLEISDPSHCHLRFLGYMCMHSA